MPMQVVAGAMLRCSMGAAPSALAVLPANRTLTGGPPAANVLDHVPLLNILPFGVMFQPRQSSGGSSDGGCSRRPHSATLRPRHPCPVGAGRAHRADRRRAGAGRCLSADVPVGRSHPGDVPRPDDGDDSLNPRRPRRAHVLLAGSTRPRHSAHQSKQKRLRMARTGHKRRATSSAAYPVGGGCTATRAGITPAASRTTPGVAWYGTR